MEVDDLEQQLLSQFRSLATSDRDVLITQFQKLIDGQMTDRGCEFFLDMTDWWVYLSSNILSQNTNYSLLPSNTQLGIYK